ncbi:hypothetical protein FA13DRAFT_774479 [Coprinellus micaceus]|uniref:DUF6533 domain-containing protein n=1 Tax=Coprinellus micaceus TaxID=71717 RepID=A0A4Y7T3B8_COPMI|nr:hypothetical protein FA13DRAFT_774479 [Coprinellus micaceus]
MAMSAKQIDALAEAVAMWRMQEYIMVSFFCLYVCYYVTTLAEEVSIILPQKWNRGKTLYLIIRHGTLVYIALQLSRDWRNYFVMSPAGIQYLVAIIILSCGVPLVNAIILIVSVFQYPAGVLGPLPVELGYPCYFPSIATLADTTIFTAGSGIRAYASLVATTLLALLGALTLAIRYRGQRGGLVNVICRDGGSHYLSLLGRPR